MNAYRLWLGKFSLFAVVWLGGFSQLFAGIFPGSARVESVGADPTSALTWNNATNALTVACWFKISIPSNFDLTEDMAIVVNSRTSPANNHAYAIYLNATSGSVEFSSRGSGGADAPLKLIERPFLERWYHVAVVRSNTTLTVYVDGRQVTTAVTVAGNSNTTDGVSIGGWGNGKYLRGEIQEVAIYQRALTRAENFTNMLRDILAAFPGLRGYFKLAYAANSTDNLKNFATTPPTGTEAVLKQGSGSIDFPETDLQGEQSVFDSRKNYGQDAVSSLNGGFSWNQDAIQRSGPGVSFNLGFGYSSGIGYNGQVLEGGLDVFSEDSVMGRGWRHAYQTRLIGGSLYLVGSNAYIGMLTSSGSIETWKRQSGGTFTTVHKEYRGELREVEFGDYIEWTTPERIIHKFYHPTNWPDSLVAGKLTHIRDFNGNTQSFTYDEFSGRLSTITDTAGGTWTFGYDNAGLLTSVNGPTANPAAKWTVTFTYTTITVAGQPQTVLATKSIAGPAPYSPVASMQWQFFYNGQGLLERIVDPRGLNDTRIAYDTYGRKTSEMDALGRSTQFEYNKPALRQLTTTELHGSNSALNRPVVDTFDRKLRLLSRLDPLGFTTSYEYDPVSGDVLTTTDARGIRSAMTYDGRSNITSRINGLGEKTEWTYAQTTDPPGSTNGHLVGATLLNKPLKDTRAATAEASAGWENRYEYDSAGNLRFHRDGPVGGANFGTLAEHAYDARGLVISSKDANGNEARFAYDPTTGFLSSRTTAFGTAQAATWNITVRTELGWPITETNPLNEPGLSG